MTKPHTEKQTIAQLEKDIKDMATLYRQPCINWSGDTSDTKKPYSEVIADYLLKFNQWDKIKQIKREETYNVGHEGIKEGEEKTNREEEWLAKSMYGKKYDYIGSIVDYQTPLKNERVDKAGKIDLLARKDKDTLYLIELKKERNKETLLRCILEIYTYSKVVDQKKLLKNFDLSEKTKVIPLIAIFKDGSQDGELKDSSNEYVHQLMKRLEVEAAILSNTGSGTVKIEEIIAP